MEKSLYDLLEEKALDPKTKDYVVSSKNYKKNKLLNRKNQKIENNHVDMINVDSNNSIFIAVDNYFLNSIAYWKDYNIHSLYDTVNDFIFGEISH